VEADNRGHCLSADQQSAIAPAIPLVCHSTRKATATPKLGICFGVCLSVPDDALSGFRSPWQ